jgi:hypothetical protein
MVKRFLNTVIPSILKPLQVLWNQLLGFLFLAFGIVVGSRVVRTWLKPEWTSDDLTAILLGGGLAVTLIGYGMHAVLRARKISRTP